MRLPARAAPILAVITAAVVVVDAARGATRAEARPASTGLYSEAGLSASSFVGRGRASSAIGPALELRLGTDLFSWLSIGAHLAAAIHEATVPRRGRRADAARPSDAECRR